MGGGFTVVHQFPSDQARSESRASRGSPIATVHLKLPQPGHVVVKPYHEYYDVNQASE